MKQLFYTLIFSSSFLFCLAGYACAQSAPMSQDSIVLEVNWLKQKLNLTDSQSTAVKAVMVSANIEIDSMRRYSAPLQQRNAQLLLMNRTLMTQIKSIFSPDQWIRYQGLEATDAETFRQHAQQQ